MAILTCHLKKFISRLFECLFTHFWYHSTGNKTSFHVLLKDLNYFLHRMFKDKNIHSNFKGKLSPSVIVRLWSDFFTQCQGTPTTSNVSLIDLKNTCGIEIWQKLKTLFLSPSPTFKTEFKRGCYQIKKNFKGEELSSNFFRKFRNFALTGMESDVGVDYF